MRRLDVIAEGLVLAPVTPLERQKICEELAGYADRTCATASLLNAADVRLTNVWKGPVGEVTFVYEEYNTITSCPSGLHLEAGDSIFICGMVDAQGYVVGSYCEAEARDVLDRYRDSLADLKGRVAASPRDINRQIELAKFHYHWGDVSSAQAIYAQVILMEPNNPVGHAQMGRLLFSQTQFAEALPHLKRAIELGSANSDIAKLYQLGCVLIKDSHFGWNVIHFPGRRLGHGALRTDGFRVADHSAFVAEQAAWRAAG